MKTPIRLLLGAAFCAACFLPSVAQQPVPPIAQQPAAPVPPGSPNPSPGVRAGNRVIVGGQQNATQRAPLVPVLSRNYLVRITVTEGEKATEYKLVTAASTISISAPGGADGARSASINGQIEEAEEGQVSVALMVSLAVPEPAPVQPGIPTQPGRGQSQSESFTASLRVRLGVEYPIFTIAARTYRLTVTPHDGQAGAPPN